MFKNKQATRYLYSNLLSGGKLFVSTWASGVLVKWQNSVKIQIQRSYCFRFRFDGYCISGLFFLCCYFSRMAWYNNCNGHLRRQYHRIIVSFKVYIFLLCRPFFSWLTQKIALYKTWDNEIASETPEWDDFLRVGIPTKLTL